MIALILLHVLYQVKVHIKLDGEDDYDLELNLAHSIVPEKSVKKVLSTKVHTFTHFVYAYNKYYACMYPNAICVCMCICIPYANILFFFSLR